MVEARAADFAPTRERLVLLDGLRFVGAALVVAFHFVGRPGPAWGVDPEIVFPTLAPIAQYGSLGVYLFFIVSGFVILMSVFGRRASSFVASRVGRLYPAYWFAVVMTGALLLLNPALNAATSRIQTLDVVVNLTMMQSAWSVPHVDGVYWTLWIELKFYLLLGLLALVGVTRSRVLMLCAFWPIGGALAQATGQQFLAALLEPNFAPFFALGMLIYVVWQDGWSAASVLLIIANWAFAMRVASSYILPWNVAIADNQLSYPLVAVIVTMMLLAVMAATLTPLAQVRWKALTFAGALAYPLYLMHEIWGWWLIALMRPVLPPYAALGVATLAVLVLAWLIYRFIERPWGPRLRNSVERSLQRGAPVPAIR